MRPQFHLFVLKSIVAHCETSEDGRILTVADLVKFFDKERLSGAVVTVSDAVDKKALRLWGKLNSRTTIKVRTGVGVTEEGEAGEVLGQGSCGGAIVSARYIDSVVDFYFNDSTSEDVYGGVRLQPLIFLDDLMRSTSSVEETNSGNMRLNLVIKEMCLQIHKTKSCYIVVGSQKFKRKVEEETKKEAIMIGEQQLKRQKCVTYLGEEIHEAGLEASIEATIDARQGKIRASIHALAALWGDHRMQLVGSTLGALDIYESCIVSSLLNNAAVWVGLTEEQEKRLDGFQLDFLRALLHLPVSTPKACLLAATSRMKIKWRVWEQKLLLILAIRQQGEDVLARQVLEEQVELGLPGLGQEVTNICSKIGLQDICRGRPDRVTKEKIKEQIFYHHLQHMKEELGALKEKGKELVKVDIRKP